MNIDSAGFETWYRYLGGLTKAEVADVMSIAPGTVAATLQQARRRLAPLLAPDTAGYYEVIVQLQAPLGGRPVVDGAA